jgi:hypothetical protein
MAAMVGCSGHCETGDGGRMASGGLSPVLALAIAATRRPTEGERGDSDSHPPHGGLPVQPTASSEGFCMTLFRTKPLPGAFEVLRGVPSNQDVGANFSQRLDFSFRCNPLQTSRL